MSLLVLGRAIAETLDAGIRTGDIMAPGATQVNTAGMGDAVIQIGNPDSGRVHIASRTAQQRLVEREPEIRVVCRIAPCRFQMRESGLN